ncbi:MAG: penicillin acylase family protein [Rubrivivax sp.]|nr:penicillin acylase family protein [Rubrivivax sp.]
MRWLVRIGVLLLLLVGAGVAWLMSGAARGPVVDGTLSAPGLSERVEVLRDGNGIPYIFAKNTPDLIRAQGFVTAQSRIFQLEAYRALASGRLAEAIGPKGLNNDREMRRIGLRRNAERHARLLSPAARDWLGWYAEGMNAYIVANAGDLPVELKLAGFVASPWMLEDMLTVLHFINWSQAANYKGELAMQAVIDRVGIERASELFPAAHRATRSGVAVAGAMPAPGAGALWLGLSDLPTGQRLAADELAAPLAVGSNNWAIAPARSASGAAVLVNDPHLDSRILPGIWMPIGLFSPDIQAVGAALPAVPGILVGRNANVAFGVTNAYGDSQDLFIEQLAPGKPDHYLDGGQARPFDTSTELIRIKDDKAPGGLREERLVVRRTVRGPIVSDQPLGARKDRLLSLRMVSAEMPGGDIGIDRLVVARNAAEVDSAVQKIDIMYFNFVFADKAGAIGHRASGRVPIRRSGHGLHPKAADGADDWTGTIAPERMPGQISPASGWVATANHDTRSADYPYEYSTFFSPPYRYDRIAEVLSASGRMTTADQARLMMDIKNLQTRHLLPRMIEALKAQPEFAEWVTLLSSWDGSERADLAAPLIYRHVYHRTAYESFVDEMGEDGARTYLKEWYVWQARFDQLLAQPQSRWFDDTRTPAVETLPDIIRRSAFAVQKELSERHGADPKAWRWGAEHRVQFDSPVRRTGFGRDTFGRAAQPYDGSNETVMRALTTRFMSGHDAEVIASMRIVADLADNEKVMAVVSGGVVERQFHRHQKNHLDAWFAGMLLPWYFDRAAIEREARARQTLKP